MFYKSRHKGCYPPLQPMTPEQQAEMHAAVEAQFPGLKITPSVRPYPETAEDEDLADDI